MHASIVRTTVPMLLVLMFGGVSANRLYGFDQFNLQKLLSLPSTWRVECPHTSVNAGGFHDPPPSHHPYPWSPRGAAHR
jgi:hypothetical protein